jgi:hypothetical protein
MTNHFLLPIVALAFQGGAHSTPKQAHAKTLPQASRPMLKDVIGQVQMPGDAGKIGTTYSLGPKNGQLNFTLESAGFSLRRSMAEDLIVAKKDEKLLTLTFSAANPLKTDQQLSEASFQFTVVSPDGKNAEYDGFLYHPERKTRFSTTLKPAQKVRAVVVIPIHAKGPVDKLIVKRIGGDVLRYDLRKEVQPLAGSFAESGDVASEEVKATFGTAVEFGQVELTVDGLVKTDNGVGSYEPSDEFDIWAATISVRNPNLTPIKYGWSVLTASATDVTGETNEWIQDLFSVANARSLDRVTIAPGESLKGRLAFRVPKGSKPKRLTLVDGTGSERSVSIEMP